MEKTKKGTKKFTEKEQLEILAEVKKNGLKVTLERYDIFPATYYYWKKKYNESEDSGLNPKVAKEYVSKIKELERENELLKLLLGEKELESKLKDELLKKKYPNLKR